MYLEKIIQHPIPLRPLFTEDVKALLGFALTTHSVQLRQTGADHETEILETIVAAIETPRDVKRLIGAFSVLEKVTQGEICAYDVLGYCWILTKSPVLRDRLAENVENLVVDPETFHFASRLSHRLDRTNADDITNILGDEARSYQNLLKLLFPSLVGLSGDDIPNRLQRRRNLVRMLYLGNPPGMLSRADVESLWPSDEEPSAVEPRLAALQRDGQLVKMIDRLDDLLSVLPADGDASFWIALSRTFTRKADWLYARDPARAIADDASTALYRLALRDRTQLQRVREVVYALIGAGDLIIVPWILRKHLFAHGLTNQNAPRRGGEVFDKEETRTLLQLEIPRYRDSVLNGKALARLPNVEVIFTILNSGNWDDALRLSLTDQLKGLEPIATFAGLFVPPGYMIDRRALGELVDLDRLRRELERIDSETHDPIDPWLEASLRRLKKIIGNEDPDFDADTYGYS